MMRLARVAGLLLGLLIATSASAHGQIQGRGQCYWVVMADSARVSQHQLERTALNALLAAHRVYPANVRLWRYHDCADDLDRRHPSLPPAPSAEPDTIVFDPPYEPIDTIPADTVPDVEPDPEPPDAPIYHVPQPDEIGSGITYETLETGAVRVIAGAERATVRWYVVMPPGLWRLEIDSEGHGGAITWGDETRPMGGGVIGGGDPGVPPLAPGGPWATGVSDSEIVINWEDRSDNEDFFVVQTRHENGFNWVQVQRPPANATQYTHHSLAPETPYEYRLRACNAAGCGSTTNFYARTLAPGETAPAPVTGTPPVFTGTDVFYKSVAADTVMVLEIDNMGAPMDRTLRRFEITQEPDFRAAVSALSVPADFTDEIGGQTQVCVLTTLDNGQVVLSPDQMAIPECRAALAEAYPQ